MEETFLFSHINRTGGLTFSHNVLHMRYSQFEICDEHNFEELSHRLRRMQPAARAALRAVAGHGVHQHLKRYFPQPCKVFSVVREPIDRWISQYYLDRKLEPDHRHYTGACHKDIVEFQRPSRNWQTRWFLGPGYLHVQNLKREHLELAKEHVEKSLDCVGTTERLKDFTYAASLVMGWRERYYLFRPQRVHDDRPARSDLDPNTLAALAEDNQLDLELYQYITQRFDAQFRKLIATNPADLEQYRTRDVIAQRLISELPEGVDLLLLTSLLNADLQPTAFLAIEPNVLKLLYKAKACCDSLPKLIAAINIVEVKWIDRKPPFSFQIDPIPKGTQRLVFAYRDKEQASLAELAFVTNFGSLSMIQAVQVGDEAV